MRVIFLMIAYPNVDRGNTSLYTDLVVEFKAKGHDVVVVAPSLDNCTEINTEGGVKVLRINTFKLFNVDPIRKGVANSLLPYQFKRAIKQVFANESFDLVITPTPPITFVSVVNWMKTVNEKIIHYLILRDIFPQNAKDIGILSNSFLFNYFRKKEEKLYNTADLIGCMSPQNIAYLKQHNPHIDHSKLHLLPNWETPTTYYPSKSAIKDKLGLKNKFVVIFGGNIGLPQQLEFILHFAKTKLDDELIRFLFIGDGTERLRLEQVAQSMNLHNVIFMKSIPRNEYNELLKECQIGLICLNEKFTIPNFPSKVLSYFNAKIPTLAALDKVTDFGDLLDVSKSGLWSLIGDLSTFDEKFNILYQSEQLRIQMGDNGYKYFVNNLTSEKACKVILDAV